MIAVDTNLLSYAHRPEMPFHERARQVLTEAVATVAPVGVPWSCAHEFVAVVANPRIFRDHTDGPGYRKAAPCELLQRVPG